MSNTITIKLDSFERNFLILLSSRSGELDMNHDGLTDKAIEALGTLEKKGAISRIQLIGTSNTFQYKLTSIGTNLVKLIEEQ